MTRFTGFAALLPFVTFAMARQVESRCLPPEGPVPLGPVGDGARANEDGEGLFLEMPGLLLQAALLLSTSILMTPMLLAQESGNFKIREHVFNEGGHPDNAVILTSTNFHIRIDAIGEALMGNALDSESFRMDAGFASPYPPPGEVQNLLFQADHQTLVWDREKSGGGYNLYRDRLDSLSSGGYGSCKEYGIAMETTTDAEEPSSGQGYFYLVTAENRLEEEGIKGFDSIGTERPNLSPCP